MLEAENQEEIASSNEKGDKDEAQVNSIEYKENDENSNAIANAENDRILGGSKHEEEKEVSKPKFQLGKFEKIAFSTDDVNISVMSEDPESSIIIKEKPQLSPTSSLSSELQPKPSTSMELEPEETTLEVVKLPKKSSKKVIITTPRGRIGQIQKQTFVAREIRKCRIQRKKLNEKQQKYWEAMVKLQEKKLEAMYERTCVLREMRDLARRRNEILQEYLRKRINLFANGNN